MTICIAGHVGAGHVFSHSGFVQDDSQGFALVSSMLCSATGVSPMIAEVETDRAEGSVTVKTVSGGTGRGLPRRGITPFEEQLMTGIKGENGCFPQRCAMKAFGRMYGHGISEVPVALEYAIAEAVMDSFNKNLRDFRIMRRDTEQANDIAGGMTVQIDDLSLTLMLTVNGSNRGTGPVEDLEGNVALDFKKELMEKLGVVNVPTIIIESKAFVPNLEGINEETFLVRYNRGADNSVVASCLENALKDVNTKWRVIDSAFPVSKGAMARNTETFSRKLSETALSLGKSVTSSEKSRIAADISRLVSQDLGGIIFMSNGIHDIYRSAGTTPGTSAVLSIVVPEEYVKMNIIPFSTDGNIKVMMKVVKRACELLSENYQKALNDICRISGNSRD